MTKKEEGKSFERMPGSMHKGVLKDLGEKCKVIFA